MGKWFRVSPRWFIDVDEIKEIGIPFDRPKTITITFKNGAEAYYKVDNPEETLERFDAFVNNRAVFSSGNLINPNDINSTLKMY